LSLWEEKGWLLRKRKAGCWRKESLAKAREERGVIVIRKIFY
jgi:hypothetical protein